MPYASLAIEVAADRVAAARWSRAGALDGYAVELLPVGALVPSAVEPNVVNSAVVKSAVAHVCDRLLRDAGHLALLRCGPRSVGVRHYCVDFARRQHGAARLFRMSLPQP